jgi:hypothetical protein
MLWCILGGQSSEKKNMGYVLRLEVLECEDNCLLCCYACILKKFTDAWGACCLHHQGDRQVTRRSDDGVSRFLFSVIKLLPEYRHNNQEHTRLPDTCYQRTGHTYVIWRNMHSPSLSVLLQRLGTLNLPRLLGKPLLISRTHLQLSCRRVNSKGISGR